MRCRAPCACLAAVYPAPPSYTSSAAIDVTVTIRPSPDSMSLGSRAFVTRSVPITLVSPHPSPVVEVGVGKLGQPLRAAGIVDEDIDSGPAVRRVLDRCVVGDIRDDGGAVDLVGQTPEAVSPACHHDDVEALRGKGSGGGFTDARARTGDDCNTGMGVGDLTGPTLSEAIAGLSRRSS